MSQGAPVPPPAAVGPPAHPLETCLRLCAAEAPKPWYPRAYAQSARLPVEALYPALEHLWLDGLVSKAEGTPETGPGLTLTPLGGEVLDDPEALQRLREGRAVVKGSQGGIVRECIRRPPRPNATWGLMAVILAVFAYGLVLCASNGVGLANFFAGAPPSWPVCESLGAMMQGEDWVRGEYWRLATSLFVHIGVLNVLIAAFFLYRVAARAEQMWGPVRFLVLFLASGVGGNLIGLALAPKFLIPGVFSGAYGLLGAEAVWVLCNDRHMPRAVAARMRTQVAWDAVLVGLCLIVPRWNYWTEFGGALVGVAVGLVLQVQRFGPAPWRWAVLGALVPLPWLGFTFVEHQRATNPEWAPINQGRPNLLANVQNADEIAKEEKLFETTYIKKIHETTNAAYDVYQEEKALLERPPGRRDPDAKDKAKRDLAGQRDKVKQLEEDLAKEGPYKGEMIEGARKTAIRFTQALSDLLAAAEARLREGEEWTPADDAKVKDMKDAAADWYKLLK